MRNPKKKSGSLYHSVEVMFSGERVWNAHSVISGEFLVQCRSRYDDRYRRKLVLVVVAATASPSKLGRSDFEYWPVWGFVSKFEEVQEKDLPLFVSWGYKSELFEKIFHGGRY